MYLTPSPLCVARPKKTGYLYPPVCNALPLKLSKIRKMSNTNPQYRRNSRYPAKALCFRRACYGLPPHGHHQSASPPQWLTSKIQSRHRHHHHHRHRRAMFQSPRYKSYAASTFRSSIPPIPLSAKNSQSSLISALADRLVASSLSSNTNTELSTAFNSVSL